MQKTMTYGGHVSAVLALGLPLIGGHLAQFAIGLTDTVMLGWYGVSELAAVTLGATLFFVLFIFGSGFAFAVMPMVAQFHAQQDEVQLRRATRMSLWLSLLYAVLALPLLLNAEPILLMAQQEPEVAANAAAYLQIAGLGVVPALIVMVLKSYLAALERTQIVLWITVLAACVNAVANYALIFGNWGAPELGITGAAIASVITQIVSVVAISVYVRISVNQHALFVRFWKPDWEMFARVFRLGWPISLTNLSEVGLFAASTLMMGWLGTVALAAHGIALSLASVTFMAHLGLSNAATVRAGNAMGRQDRPHLARGAVVVTVMSLVFSAVTVVILLLWPEPLISLFLNPEEPDRAMIMQIGVTLVAMAALFQLVDGAQVIALGLLRGLQDTAVPMVIAGFSYWVVGITVSYTLGFTMGWGGAGVWLGLVIGLSVASGLLMWRFWSFGLTKVGHPDTE